MIKVMATVRIMEAELGPKNHTVLGKVGRPSRERPS
jgi:hypothetical protein